MRVLMWFAIGFAAGCIPGSYFHWDSRFVYVGIFLLVCGIGLFLRKNKVLRKTALVLFGVFAAIMWMWGYQSIHLEPARKYADKQVLAKIEITDYSWDTTYGGAASGKVYIDGQSFKVNLYLDGSEKLKPGDVVSGEFRLRMTTFEEENEVSYYQGTGVFLLAYAIGELSVEESDSVPIKYYASELRHDIVNTLDTVFPEDVKGIAKALLLGDSSDLTYEEDSDLKVSGIRHVIAVSGLHISILFAMVYTLSGKRRFITPLIGIPVLILFAAVAGFTPSIVRACIMQCLMMGALLFNKEYDPPTALSFAVLILLMINPMAITSVSLQLSVGCMIGIFLFSSRISAYVLRVLRVPKGKSLRAKAGRWIAGSVGVTLSATAVTIPLSAFYFGTVSLVSVFTNLLALWVINIVFYGIMLACVAGAIWTPLGTAVGWVVAWLIRYVLWIAKLMASIPYAAVYTCSAYVLLWLAFCYLLLFVLLISKKKRPGIILACMCATLILTQFLSWLEPRRDSFRVTILDVGQGQSILLQSDGKTYLVDCGGSTSEYAADQVWQYLQSQGIFTLDGLILTHYDIDHAGGVPYLLSQISVRTMYLPDISDNGKIKGFLEQNYASSIRWIRSESSVGGETGNITMIPAENHTDENESSMCILFQADNCDILITGDRSTKGEQELLLHHDIPQLELLVAGHHGANTSTGRLLLSAAQPKAVAISVEKDNFYGHPSAKLLERLEEFGCTVYRTDMDGTIVFRR